MAKVIHFLVEQVQHEVYQNHPTIPVFRLHLLTSFLSLFTKTEQLLWW